MTGNGKLNTDSRAVWRQSFYTEATEDARIPIVEILVLAMAVGAVTLCILIGLGPVVG